MGLIQSGGVNDSFLAHLVETQLQRPNTGVTQPL